MDQEELSAFNQDTRDSIRGKNNYQPTGGMKRGGYWPVQNPNDVPQTIPYGATKTSMSKDYSIKEVVEMPTQSLIDIFMRVMADSMQVTKEEAEKIFKIN